MCNTYTTVLLILPWFNDLLVSILLFFYLYLFIIFFIRHKICWCLFSRAFCMKQWTKKKNKTIRVQHTIWSAQIQLDSTCTEHSLISAIFWNHNNKLWWWPATHTHTQNVCNSINGNAKVFYGKKNCESVHFWEFAFEIGFEFTWTISSAVFVVEYLAEMIASFENLMSLLFSWSRHFSMHELHASIILLTVCWSKKTKQKMMNNS